MIEEIAEGYHEFEGILSDCIYEMINNAIVKIQNVTYRVTGKLLTWFQKSEMSPNH